MYNRFRPGKPWYDTEGKRIQAHGGSIIEAEGKYFWYGENKEKSNGEGDIWHWGMKIYSSLDLYNWKDKRRLYRSAGNNLLRKKGTYVRQVRWRTQTGSKAL